jgi:hypothetical protein
MQIEISDPAYLASLRDHLQQHGCPTEPQGPEVVEVRVLWTDRPPSDSEQRAKLVGHLREWCAANPGVKANILS